MKVNDSQNSNSINNKKNPVIKILIGTAKFKTTITPTSNNTKEMIIISNEWINENRSFEIRILFRDTDEYKIIAVLLVKSPETKLAVIIMGINLKNMLL